MSFYPYIIRKKKHFIQLQFLCTVSAKHFCQSQSARRSVPAYYVLRLRDDGAAMIKLLILNLTFERSCQHLIYIQLFTTKTT